jgi:AP-2 complex subunit alpha
LLTRHHHHHHRPQEQQLINVACLHEFADALPIQVSYLANGKSENLSLRLPIVLTKFVEPVLLDATGFFGLWKKLAGPPYGTTAFTEARMFPPPNH